MNVYSAPAERQALWTLVEDIPTHDSGDGAIVAATYSLLEIARQNPELEIQAVIVTDGSTDSAVLSSLAGATDKLADYDNVVLHVVGVAPEARMPFSGGFSALPHVTFSSSVEEMAVKFHAFGE